MITNKLKINDSKTEFIVFRSPQLKCDLSQGLPNLIGRWLPTGQPSITIWLPNNDWWLPNNARHKMLTFGG